MCVLFPRAQDQTCAEQTAQAVWHSRPPLGNPDRIRHNHGIRLWNRAPVSKPGGKMRAPDLFFQFPQELDVDRPTLFDCISSTKHGRESRALIIGRSSPPINSFFILEGKRRLPPFRLLSWLHVQMIVDRDSRAIRPCYPPAGDNGEPTGLYHLDLGIHPGQVLPRKISHASHIARTG